MEAAETRPTPDTGRGPHPRMEQELNTYSDSYLKDEISKTSRKLQQDESGKRWAMVLQTLVSEVGDIVTRSLLEYTLYQNRIIMAQNELILRALESHAYDRP